MFSVDRKIFFIDWLTFLMTNKYPTPTILINECQIFQLKQPIRKNYTPHHAFTRGLVYHFPSHLVVNLQNSLFLKSNISVCAFIQPYINFTRMKIFLSSISLNHGHYFGYIRGAVYMLSGLLIVLVILSADSFHSIARSRCQRAYNGALLKFFLPDYVGFTKL